MNENKTENAKNKNVLNPNNRECRTYGQVKSAYEKIRKLLEENGEILYIAGGIVPYILLNEDSNRLHDDIDTIANLQDMTKLREIFKKAGLYNPKYDSRSYVKNEEDYGFEVVIVGVPVGIYPFRYDNGKITQYTYDPYTHECKIKEFEVEEVSDYIASYTGKDGRIYDAMSLEYIKLTKDKYSSPRREKDKRDLAKILQFGIREDVYRRIQTHMIKQIQSIKAESLDKHTLNMVSPQKLGQETLGEQKDTLLLDGIEQALAEQQREIANKIERQENEQNI